MIQLGAKPLASKTHLSGGEPHLPKACRSKESIFAGKKTNKQSHTKFRLNTTITCQRNEGQNITLGQIGSTVMHFIQKPNHILSDFININESHGSNWNGCDV